jgi:hypothetical protein
VAAAADCGDANSTGHATVAKCCDPVGNTWELETCNFSSLIMREADPIPGGGAPESDCVSEWIVRNPTNVPELDHKGLTSGSQTCVDGDPTCDEDSTVNGHCLFQVSVCVNNEDGRLLDGTEPACLPSEVASWELRQPRPDSPKAVDAANAVALRSALGALGASTVRGSHQEVVTFGTALIEHDRCTDLATIDVPLRGTYLNKKGKVSITGRATTPILPSGKRGTRDTDTLKLFCLPAL